LKVSNISETSPIQLDEGKIPPLEARELVVPARFFLGPMGTVEVRIDQRRELKRLAPSLFLSSDLVLSGEPVVHAVADMSDDQADSVLSWLESIMTVLQSAVRSHDFYQKATHALVRLIGMDSGWALTREDNAWHVQAEQFSARMRRAPRPSQ